MADDVGAMALFADVLVCVATKYDIGPSILKHVHAQLNLAKICDAQKGKMSTIIGILTFMSMITRTS